MRPDKKEAEYVLDAFSIARALSFSSTLADRC